MVVVVVVVMVMVMVMVVALALLHHIFEGMCRSHLSFRESATQWGKKSKLRS